MNHLHRNRSALGSFAQTDLLGGSIWAHSMIAKQNLRTIFRLVLPLGLLLAAFWGMTGCSSSPAKGGSQTPLISLAMTQSPPASLTVGGSATVSATVNNDLANAGVDWVAACNGGLNCGSFSPPHTPSGGTTTFTAPTAVPPKSTISISALSSTDRSKYSSANVTVLSIVTGIAITQAPPVSAPASGIVTVAATVAGDPANLGVDWKANCGGVDCTPPGWHSASGAATTFLVPNEGMIPTIVGSTVTLTAYATADHSFTAIATFTVTAPISVTITQAPPASMAPNATGTVTAVVANDPTNSGVIWQVACSSLASGACGTVSPAQTASGASVTFTAPSTVPTPSPIVTIYAYPTAVGVGSNVVASANVTIVAPISVTLSTGVPGGAMAINSGASLVATVSNDPANAGVDWTVTCANPGACGSFSLIHTVSGATTTYTSPAAPPTGGTVTIIAASTTPPHPTATQTVTISTGKPPLSLLQGNSVLLLSATNSQNGPYALGGFITADGAGNITIGHVDLVDGLGNASQYNALLPSTYTIGTDGRGKMTLLLNTASLNGFGVNNTGEIDLSIVFVSPSHALLSETDSYGTATGTLDVQNAADLAAFQQGAWTKGNYALKLSGAETALPHPNFFVTSALSLDFSASSYSYTADQSDGGRITSVPFATALSNVNVFRAGYYVTFNSLNLGLPTQFTFDAWLIDATHFVVIDVADSSGGSPPVIVSGYLTIQPSSPSISGSYAFTEAGATTAAQPQVAGGIFTCGSTGTLDVVPLSPLAGTGLNDQAINLATCSAPANGRGSIGISGATTAGISQFAAYPTSDQGLYLIELDGGKAGTSGPSGAGVALQQTLGPPSTKSAYGSYFTARTALGSEVFAAQLAQIVSGGVSTLSGAGDVTSFDITAAPPIGTPSSGATLTGSYGAASGGRVPVTLTIAPATGPPAQPAPQIKTLHSLCYMVDANSCLLLGSDSTAPGTGVLQLQNTGL
jgi:hypothetical protein